MADLRIPISPIHSMVQTAGDATHPPYIRLLNPAASGFILRVYEIYVGTNAAPTNRMKMRRISASGIGTGGTVTTGLTARRDENDATSIVATLVGCTAHTGTIFTEAQSFWYDKLPQGSSAGYNSFPILAPGSFPLIVKANSAIEFASGDAAAASVIGLYAIWDEIAG